MSSHLTLEIDLDDNGQATDASLIVYECVDGVPLAPYNIRFELLTIQIGSDVPSSITAVLKEDEMGSAAETKLLLENSGVRATIMPA
jgi:hypothetical protein